MKNVNQIIRICLLDAMPWPTRSPLNIDGALPLVTECTKTASFISGSGLDIVLYTRYVPIITEYKRYLKVWWTQGKQ